MYLLSLSLPLLLITTALCQLHYNYSVLDTIGTEVFAYTELDINIYNTNLDDCYLFQFANGELRFSRDYDFNREFDKLKFNCSVLISNSAGTLTVYVYDTNDHSPYFLKTEYQIYINENFDDATIITIKLPTAFDFDNYPYDVSSYSLVGDSISLDHFSFSPNPPTLNSTRLIDRENVSRFSFSLTAYDGGTPSMNSSAVPIQVIVNDLNDNRPEFSQHQSSFNISEDQVSGYSVGVFSAKDVDSGSNGEITYQLISQRAFKDGEELSVDEYLSPFRINASTGEVTLFGELHFDQFDYLVFTIEAQDLGIPPLYNYTTIGVRVIDVLEPLPPPQLTFTNVESNDTILMVYENKDEVLSLISLEPPLPLGANAYVTLMSYPDNSATYPLYLKTNTRNVQWSLQFSGILDRENVSRYQLLFQLIIVNISDTNDNRTSNSRITVIVLDVNDNSPRILNPPTDCISVPENTRGIIYTLNATDMDIGVNAELEYSLLHSDGYESNFRINSTSGVVELVTELDFEEVRMFYLNLGVTDGGIPSLTVNTTLSICVDNLNDNSIIFEYASLILPVNTPLHTKLLTVRASDKDNTSESIFYHLTPLNNETFQLNAKTGELFLNACLPHGLSTEIQVFASHCSDPSNNSSHCEVAYTPIRINVTEREPILQFSTYTVCLETNRPMNYSLSLLSSNTTALNGTDLIISTNGSDYTLNVVDNHDSLDSHLECKGDDLCDVTLNHECDTNHTELTSLNVLFVSEIDSSLQFTETMYEISQLEGEYANSTIIDFSQFICYDNYNSPVFSLIGDYPESLFALTRSGLLLLSASVDVDSINATTNYTFSIQAESNDVIANTELLLIITPTNDNTPRFYNASKQLNLYSYSPYQFVARFQARDLDIGRDGMLLYYLTIELSWLVLNETTGILSISNNFSTATQFVTNRTYNGTITVRDRGYPPKQSSHKFSLFLRDRIYIIPATYWHFVVIPICLLILLLFVLILIILIILYVCRYKFCFNATYRVDSAKSSRVWEVLKNNNVSEVRDSDTRNGGNPPVNSTPRSSGIGLSINSTPSSLVPMTDEEIKQIIDDNRDLVKECGSIPTLHDYNEESPAPPTLAGEDSDLHLVFGDEISQVSNSASDKRSQYEPPIDIIFANPDTRYLEPSHSPQSSASSSYLSSVSHQRPKVAYYNAPPIEVVKRPEVNLVPLPSTSTPSFSRNIRAHSQQPDAFDSLDAPI